MTIDELLVALAKNGTRILLDETGHALRIRGGRPSPTLLDAVKDHKPDLVVALHEGRFLAADLSHSCEVDDFARELHVARRCGTISGIDWCAAQLAVTLARRWQRANRERAA